MTALLFGTDDIEGHWHHRISKRGGTDMKHGNVWHRLRNEAWQWVVKGYVKTLTNSESESARIRQKRRSHGEVVTRAGFVSEWIANVSSIAPNNQEDRV
jgi:hypothetical protein